jgi:thiol-disulfide isomerase/thioredoxin
MLKLGTPMPQFELLEPLTNKNFSSATLAGKPTLVAFICNHCPYVINIENAFATLTMEYMEQGINVVAINANDVENYQDDSPEKMIKKSNEAGYHFPYLYDAEQSVAKTFTAACTPDFFLFDAQGKLIYRGEFDDSRPGNDITPTGMDMRAAFDAALEGKIIPEDQQLASLGCNIKWKEGNAPEYFS